MTDIMTDEQESRAEKIVKLLKKAESTTPAEAEALTAKAEQLMARWAIDDAMLSMAEGKSKPVEEKLVEHKVELTGIFVPAHIQLAASIATGVGAKPLVWKKSSTKATFYFAGWEKDVERAEMLLASLMIQAARALQTWQKDNPIPSYWTAMEKYKARRDFLFGFADGVGTRLYKAQAAAKEEVKKESTDGGKSMELALVDRDQKKQQWYDQQYGKARGGRGRGYSTGRGGGYSAGNDAGRSADVGGTGIGGSRGSIGRGR